MSNYVKSAVRTVKIKLKAANGHRFNGHMKPSLSFSSSGIMLSSAVVDEVQVSEATPLLLYRMRSPWIPERGVRQRAFGRRHPNGRDARVPFDQIFFCSREDRQRAGFGSSSFDLFCTIDPVLVESLHARLNG